MKVMIGQVEVEVAANEEDIMEINRNTPVKTGRLRDGFEVIRGEIHNDVEYFEIIEYGTSTRPGHFMVMKAIPAIERRMARDVERQLDNKDILKIDNR